jgi:hypothetical protein
MDIAIIESLSNVGFPLAFLIITYGALKVISPIVKNFLDTYESLLKTLVDIQNEQKDILRAQHILIHTIEQRLNYIEKNTTMLSSKEVGKIKNE